MSYRSIMRWSAVRAQHSSQPEFGVLLLSVVGAAWRVPCGDEESFKAKVMLGGGGAGGRVESRECGERPAPSTEFINCSVETMVPSFASPWETVLLQKSLKRKALCS